MYSTVLWSTPTRSSELPTWAPSAQLRSYSYGQPPAQQVSVASSSFRMIPHPKAPDHQPLNTPVNMISDFVSSPEPSESEATRRARYAANQRHSKAQQKRKDSHQNEDIQEPVDRAAEKKQRHREINKVAAAKHRSRQRKQSQKLQEEGRRLGKQNAELKSVIQELREELTGLRWGALDHQRCCCNAARYRPGWENGNVVDGLRALRA